MQISSYRGVELDREGKYIQMITTRISSARKITGTLDLILFVRGNNKSVHIHETIKRIIMIYGWKVWQVKKIALKISCYQRKWIFSYSLQENRNFKYDERKKFFKN